MPTRRLVKSIPACRARMDLLRWTENYLRQQAADILGAGDRYGVSFAVTIQDSWGSLETHSIEEVPAPLEGDVERVRFELVCYEQADDPYHSGDEYFTVSVTFANNPALAVCQMRLTGDTAVKLVGGMWSELERRIKSYPMRGVVRRLPDGWLIGLLGTGLGLVVVTTVLFTLHVFGAASAALWAALLVLSYAFCSWRLPHCVFDTGDNEHRLDWNKRFWWAAATSVGIAVAVRATLKIGFEL